MCWSRASPCVIHQDADRSIRTLQLELEPPKMLQRRIVIAAAASLFAVLVAPARGADSVSVNDTARFLAGLPPAAESPLARLTGDPAWQEHARTFDAAFEHVEQSQLTRIRAWSANNL